MLMNIFAAFSSQPRDHRGKWCHRQCLNATALNRAAQIKEQLKRYLDRFRISVSAPVDAETARKCFTAGFFANAAKLHADGTYRSIRHGFQLHIHPTSIYYMHRNNFKQLPPFVLGTVAVAAAAADAVLLLLLPFLLVGF